MTSKLQEFSEAYLTELTSDKPLLMYHIHGSFDLTIEEVQSKLDLYFAEKRSPANQLQEVRRPLYGLKFEALSDNGILTFAQMLPTREERLYHYVDLDPSARLYLEKGNGGLSMFVVSESYKFDSEILTWIAGY